MPLQFRKAKLAELLHECGDPVRYCDHLIGRGEAFFDAVRDAGLEGMVAKRRRSEYSGALKEDWLKIKCLRVHDFVIGGWIGTDKNKPSALLLGEFLDGALRYVGRIGNPSDSRLMSATLRLVNSRQLALHGPLRHCFRAPLLRAVHSRVGGIPGVYRRWIFAVPRFRRYADEVFSKN